MTTTTRIKLAFHSVIKELKYHGFQDMPLEYKRLEFPACLQWQQHPLGQLHSKYLEQFIVRVYIIVILC